MDGGAECDTVVAFLEMAGAWEQSCEEGGVPRQLHGSWQGKECVKGWEERETKMPQGAPLVQNFVVRLYRNPSMS